MAMQDQQNRNSIPQSRQNLDYNLPQQTFKVQGMKTDLSESSFENSFAFENKNMRINIVDEDNTLMNLTNERGTKFVDSIKGIPIGIKKYASNKALLFTTTNTGTFDVTLKQGNDTNTPTIQNENSNININEFEDFIYKIEQNGNIVKVEEIQKFNNSNTKFSAHNPLEIESYKDGDKDYFYIADGINNFKSFCLQDKQITANSEIVNGYDRINLDYICKISGDESISVKTIQSTNGEFFSGVIIYCFAYKTHQGHLTNVIDVSDLIQLTNFGLKYGLEPNKRCNIANIITVNGLTSNFKEIEVYSLFRSTLDGEITVRKVCNLDIKQRTTEFTDLNQGEIISYQELLTRFNSVLIPSTITQKSSSIFLGNLRTNNYNNLKNLLLNNITQNQIRFTSIEYDFTRDNQYFYGIQLQDLYGNWSPVIYVGSSNEIYEMEISSDYQRVAIQNGYIAVRAMVLDNRRIRNTICEGVTAKTWSLESSKYGIDYYSPYFYNVYNTDIYSKDNNRITPNISNVVDFYSPDIEFDENFSYNTNSEYILAYKNLETKLAIHNYDVAISGNIGILYNNESNDIGKFSYEGNDIDGFRYLWRDAISGYQKALQILIHDYRGGKNDNDSRDDVISSLYTIGKAGIKELPTDYVIYLWQPSGSLNDSNGKTSVLKYKKIARKYNITHNDFASFKNETVNIKLFDGTNNNIPVNGVEVYGGIVNQKIYPSSWSIDELYRESNVSSDETFWDENQAALADEYALSILNTYHYVGQPIEFYYQLPGENKSVIKTQEFSALAKMYTENSEYDEEKLCVRTFRGTNGTSLGDSNLKSIFSNGISNNDLTGLKFSWAIEKYGYEYGYSDNGGGDGNGDGSGILTGSFAGRRRKHEFEHICTAKIRVTNQYNRSGNINITYKTPKHLVLFKNSNIHGGYCQLKQNKSNYEINNKDIETGQWIICSKKVKLDGNNDTFLDVDINEVYEWNGPTNPYECLKTEPYSLNDENQVTCVLSIHGLKSYINPMCRYDNLRNLSDYNGITSAVFNKMNMVYNQKNNFFVFSGITEDTITDDSLENTILYSDMKLANEKDDSFVNFSNTNFYTIDSNISKINKLITYNDKLLCFSDNAISQILYNENVVINTDSVQSLGLASTDKITGSQLITNTYGCLNKWSIGIYNNVLFFNDDLNNKLLAYSNDFSFLNETLNIETLNPKILKKDVWNPVSWGNTKLNIDNLAKDVHYTGSDIDIALNQAIGHFTSLYSYEKIPYIETIGNYSIAIRNIKNTSEVYLLRQGDYNHFFGKFEPYWTTVIVNQNSLVNKMISNLEFSTEAYDYNMLPVQDFTFDHIEFWNDYQSNKMAVNYKLYGQSLLKKKFRVWRINHFRNSTKLIKRNYDMMSNTWHYLKLSTEIENSNKLTLHWLNVNYR